jgi:dienelactone hydrolase
MRSAGRTESMAAVASQYPGSRLQVVDRQQVGSRIPSAESSDLTTHSGPVLGRKCRRTTVLRPTQRLAVLLGILLPFLPAIPARAQEAATLEEVRGMLYRHIESLSHELATTNRRIDDLMFFHRLGEIAEIDMVSIAGPPLRYQPNPTTQGAGNPFRFRAYVFIPKNLDRSERQPLLVYPHGGVHSNFGSGASGTLRELLVQGHTIVAPEYRGSTGYGRGSFEAIDHGGLEIEDTYAARAYMLERHDFLDEDRVGIIGWSHGGLHALMNIFEHGEDYAVAFAGVPVSDIVERMGYKTQGYRDLYSAEYHIGKTAYEDVDEYRRRSPSWNAHKYDGTPLLIYTNTNDQDVNVLEVERLIQALHAEGKKGFEYKIFQDALGGHGFTGLDTPLARKARRDIYRFLARHLRPHNPVR